MTGGVFIDWGIRVTTGGAQKWEYKNKLCDYKFWKQINNFNMTCHIGTWNKKLHTISNGKAKSDSGNIDFQARSRYITDNREINTRATATPVKGVGFTSFEDDLI